MKKTILALALTLASTQILAQMDHSSMDHSKMNMEGMDHSKMMGDMKGMDHSQMNMDEMSDVGMPAKGAKPDKVVHVILDLSLIHI